MGAGVEFVTVEHFDEKGVRTHICEVLKRLLYGSKCLHRMNRGIDLFVLPVNVNFMCRYS